MKLIESKFYEKEKKYIDEALSKLIRKANERDIYMVGSTADKIYLDDKNNFVKKNFFPVSKDLDILVKNETFNSISQFLSYYSYPSFKTTYTFNEIKEVFLPFKNYKLDENIDVFVGSVCAIPADENAYKIGGSVKYKEYNVYAPNKSFVLATHINPLAITINRLNRFFILSTDEYVKNGDEQFKAIFDDTLYYVAKGNIRVNNMKLALMHIDKTNPILLEKEFIEYDSVFEKYANYIENDTKKLIKIAKFSDFSVNDAEKVVNIIVEKIRNEYYKIWKEMKRN
jgi:hypothetical protein